MEALGRTLDLCVGAQPADSNAAAITGKRVSMKDCEGITIAVIKAAGTANDDPVFTLQQHTATTGGTTSSLVAIDHYYLKNAATLAGSEAWVRFSQTLAATITDPGGAGTSAESQQILVIEVDATKLSDGYGWISLNVADTGAAGVQWLSILYIRRDLKVQRKPANLASSLA
jgi:hypothetical protein